VRSSRGGPCCCCQSGSSSLAFPLFYLLWPERAAADLHHPFPTHPGLPRLRLNSTCGRPGSSRGSRRGPHEHGHSLWLPSTSDVCPMRRGVPRLRIRPGAYPRTLAKAPRRLQQGQDRRGPDGVGSIRLSRLWSRSVFYTLLLAGQLRSLTDIPFFVCYYPICSDGICPDLSKAPPDLQKMAESLKRDEAFDVQQIISSALVAFRQPDQAALVLPRYRRLYRKLPRKLARVPRVIRRLFDSRISPRLPTRTRSPPATK
jgi:hypothetical protein